MAQAPAAAQIEEPLSAPGPHGPLAGTLTRPSTTSSADCPVLVIVPGSGPIDRDGNAGAALQAAPYRALAHTLAQSGYLSLRIDKRGLYGSSAAIPDPNAVTLSDYADDLAAWTTALRERLEPTTQVIPFGHSEGGIVTLIAAARGKTPDGVILAATPGLPLDDVLRHQIRANVASDAIYDAADRALVAVADGSAPDLTDLPSDLQSLFAPPVRNFLRDAFSHDPATLAARITSPLLILQGARDLQVDTDSAHRLAHAASDAELHLIPDMNHVLKSVPTDDTAANLSAYTDPDRPISHDLLAHVIRFLARQR